MRRRHTVAGLAAGALAALLLLIAPMAWADGSDIAAAAPVTERPAASASAPVALARTGLDLTVPAIVGLAILVLGTMLVAWAVLRGSRSRRTHP